MLKPAALVLLALPKPQQVHSLGKKTRILRVDMTTQELILAENAVKKNKQIYMYFFRWRGLCHMQNSPHSPV